MKHLFLCLFLLTLSFCDAQSNYQFGILPSLNINKKLTNNYNLNFKLESRQEIKSGFFDRPSDFNYEYILTDFLVVFSKKIAINKSLGIGYVNRIRAGKLFNRSIQQFIMTKGYPGIRLSHRFSSDQTFAKEEDPEYRLRYRVSSEISLNGQSVNPREFYLKINNEYLNSLQGGDYDLEVRVRPNLGYKFSDTKKLEFGLDYRLNSFINASSRNRFWIGIGWYQVI